MLLLDRMADSLQRVLAVILAFATSPVLLLAILLLQLESRGPVLYRAVRAGEGGHPFTCLKLRTMTGRLDGPAITVAADRRLGSIGRIIRRLRLDELPQLWNVVRGEMRLVGPRPEDPRFIDLTDPLHREVFTSRPGVTGLSQLVFADEATLLDAADPERQYRDSILPEKVRVDAAYLRARSGRLDLWILAQTPLALLGRQVQLPEPVRRQLDALAR